MARWKSIVADVVCVLAFVAIGRRNHGESSALGEYTATAWPFLAGLALATTAALRRKRPAGAPRLGHEAVATGVLLAPVTAVLGLMIRRVFTDRGTAAAFVIVAMLFLALTMVGWRFVGSRVASARAAR